MVEKCFGSWIIKDCIEIQVKEKKVVVLCCRSQQNAVKLGRFTPSSGTDGKEMYKKAWRRVVVFILNLLLFAAFFPLAVVIFSKLSDLVPRGHYPFGHQQQAPSMGQD